MSIRFRVALTMVFVIAMYAVIEFTVQHLVILPSYEKSERGQAEADSRRATGALRSEIENLDLLLFDWSAWDDTYAFVVNPSDEYQKANLVELTFTQNKLNLIYFVDTTGKVVWGQAYDLNKGQRIEMDEFPARQWAVTHPLLQHRTPDSNLTGVFLTRLGPMLLSSRPIITTNNQGPIRGTMMTGRFLDDKLVRRLSDQAQIKMHVWPLNKGDAPREDRAALMALVKGSRTHLREIGDRLLRVSTLFAGIDGKPALLVSVDVSRDIMVQGRAAFRVLRVTTVVVVVSGLVIVLALLHIVVVNPITKLTDYVTHVRATDALTLLPPPRHKHEIGTLTREFNQMIRRIQRDAAERARAEEALRESEARIRAIIDTAPDGIVIVDENGLIETFNPAAERLFGYTVDEVVGKPIHDLVRSSGQIPDAGKDRQADRPVPASGLEGLGHRKDGTTFPVHWTVSEARLGGRLLFTGIVRDVTVLKQMHEDVLRAEHLATIGAMGASVAHEVRNPLAGISGAVQVLRDGFPADDARRKVVDDILEGVMRVDAIVRRLLMFAKMWLPVRDAVDLRKLADDVTKVAKTREMWKDVQFGFAGETVLEAWVDSVLIEQVLWNLLENAGDAILQAQTAHNMQGAIQWEFRKMPRGVRVTLRDNGCGIAPEAQQKMFRPFFTTKTHGTGLGLAICRRIMEAHGGSIEIVSTSECGAQAVLDFANKA